MLAYVFDIRIEYYDTRNTGRRSIYNEDGTDAVVIEFNGINHYSRLGRRFASLDEAELLSAPSSKPAEKPFYPAQSSSGNLQPTEKTQTKHTNQTVEGKPIIPAYKRSKIQAQYVVSVLDDCISTLNYVGSLESGRLVKAHVAFQESTQEQLREFKRSHIQPWLNIILKYQEEPSATLSQSIKRTNTVLNKKVNRLCALLKKAINTLEPPLEISQSEFLRELLGKLVSSFTLDDAALLNHLKEKIWRKLFKSHVAALPVLSDDQKSTCFISYAWGNKHHEQQVHRLAKDLKCAGINVKLDIWDNKTGSVPVFASLVNEVDYVLVIGTSELMRKWNNYKSNGQSDGRVGENYRGNWVCRELDQIGNRLTEKSINNHGIIKILLEGKHKTSLPGFLKPNPSSDTDFREINKRHVSFCHLLVRLLPGNETLIAGRIKAIKSLEGTLTDQRHAWLELGNSEDKSIIACFEDLCFNHSAEKKAITSNTINLREYLHATSTEPKDIGESYKDAYRQEEQAFYNLANTSGFPIGVDNFQEVIKGNYYYIDKTAFILHVLGYKDGHRKERERAKVRLITRPRRFGKTLNMSMLYFFLSKDITDTWDERERVYKELHVGKLLGDKFIHHFAQYPVIFFSMKSLSYGGFFSKASSGESQEENAYRQAFSGLLNLASREYKDFKALIGPKLNPGDKAAYNAIVAKKLSSDNLNDRDELIHSIQKLCNYLKDVYRKTTSKLPIILIDEYDHPINEFHRYKAAHKLISDFLSTTLKNDDLKHRSYEFATVTGISRVAQMSIFSNLNNVKTYTLINDTLFGQDFGLTQLEVGRLFAWKQGQLSEENEDDNGDGNNQTLDCTVDDLRTYYGGYTIHPYVLGEASIYNPWSLFSCLDAQGDLRQYWTQTSTANLLDDIVLTLKKRAASLRSLVNHYEQLQHDTAMLIKGNDLCLTLEEHFNFKDLYESNAAFWGLLLATGYITVVEAEKTKCRTLGKSQIDEYQLQVKIPNQELQSFFKRQYDHWFGETESELLKQTVDVLTSAISSKSSNLIQKYLRNLLRFTFLNDDVFELLLKLLKYPNKNVRWRAQAHLTQTFYNSCELLNAYYDLLANPDDDLRALAWQGLRYLDKQYTKETSKIIQGHLQCLLEQGVASDSITLVDYKYYLKPIWATKANFESLLIIFETTMCQNNTLYETSLPTCLQLLVEIACNSNVENEDNELQKVLHDKYQSWIRHPEEKVRHHVYEALHLDEAIRDVTLRGWCMTLIQANDALAKVRTHALTILFKNGLISGKVLETFVHLLMNESIKGERSEDVRRSIRTHLKQYPWARSQYDIFKPLLNYGQRLLVDHPSKGFQLLSSLSPLVKRLQRTDVIHFKSIIQGLIDIVTSREATEETTNLKNNILLLLIELDPSNNNILTVVANHLMQLPMSLQERIGNELRARLEPAEKQSLLERYKLACDKNASPEDLVQTLRGLYVLSEVWDEDTENLFVEVLNHSDQRVGDIAFECLCKHPKTSHKHLQARFSKKLVWSINHQKVNIYEKMVTRLMRLNILHTNIIHQLLQHLHHKHKSIQQASLSLLKKIDFRDLTLDLHQEPEQLLNQLIEGLNDSNTDAFKMICQKLTQLGDSLICEVLDRLEKRMFKDKEINFNPEIPSDRWIDYVELYVKCVRQQGNIENYLEILKQFLRHVDSTIREKVLGFVSEQGHFKSESAIYYELLELTSVKSGSNSDIHPDEIIDIRLFAIRAFADKQFEHDDMVIETLNDLVEDRVVAEVVYQTREILGIPDERVPDLIRLNPKRALRFIESEHLRHDLIKSSGLILSTEAKKLSERIKEVDFDSDEIETSIQRIRAHILEKIHGLSETHETSELMQVLNGLNRLFSSFLEQIKPYQTDKSPSEDSSSAPEVLSMDKLVQQQLQLSDVNNEEQPTLGAIAKAVSRILANNDALRKQAYVIVSAETTGNVFVKQLSQQIEAIGLNSRHVIIDNDEVINKTFSDLLNDNQQIILILTGDIDAIDNAIHRHMLNRLLLFYCLHNRERLNVRFLSITKDTPKLPLSTFEYVTVEPWTQSSYKEGLIHLLNEGLGVNIFKAIPQKLLLPADGFLEIFSVNIHYPKFTKTQAKMIQPTLQETVENSADYIKNSKIVKKRSGYITSVTFTDYRAAEGLKNELMSQLTSKDFHAADKLKVAIQVVVGIKKTEHQVIAISDYDSSAVEESNRYYKQRARIGAILKAGHWHLPTFNESLYVDRKLVTEAIERHFQVDEASSSDKTPTAVESPRTVVLSALHGLGGIGKTQIAMAYIHQAKGYQFRCWFDASNLSAEYRQFASKMGLVFPDEKVDDQEINARVCRWFETQPGWLVVYDNATDLSSIKGYLPKRGGDVLVTSRDAASPWWQLGEAILVDLMTAAEAIALLEKIRGKEDKQHALLAEKLGYSPLALAQAGAYIRETSGYDVSRYLDLYAEAQALLLSQNRLGEDELGQPHVTVMTTWAMSVKAVEKAEHGEQAMVLLQVCAYLALSISDRLLKEILDLEGAKGDIELLNIKLVLKQYSLIDDREDNTITIHQLLQLAIREQHQADTWCWLRKASEMIDDDYWKDREDIEDYHKVSLAPHFVSIKKHLEKCLADNRTMQSKETRLAIKCVLAQVVADFGILQGDLYQYREAQGILERALAIKQSVYGESHPGVAATLGNLGLVCRDLGKYRDAKAYQEQALEIEELVYGKSHPVVAATLGNLGLVCYDLGEYRETKAYQEQALAIEQSVYGESHPAVARTLGNLGLACRALGEYREAKAYQAQALAIEQSVYGASHPEVAATLGNLGLACRALGEYREAKAYQAQALAIEQSVYGESHPEVAATLGNLGEACRALGEYREAKAYQAQALAIEQSVYGESHPGVAATLGNLGLACHALGEYREAKAYQEQALAIKQSVYGESHPVVAATLGNLGNACHALGEYREAKAYQEQALVIKQSVYGELHPAVAATLGNLGLACHALGEYRHAKDYQEQALAINNSVYGESHPAVAVTLENLGNACHALGKYRHAKDYQEQALAINNSVYGESHPAVAVTLENLGNACHALGKYREAKAYQERALAIKQSVYGGSEVTPVVKTNFIEIIESLSPNILLQ